MSQHASSPAAISDRRWRAAVGLPATLALVLLAHPALAHTEAGIAGGLLSGFLHPILGPDHVIAMVAVGL
jgi:hydrogenase/urease accessory protein HupE